MQYVAIIYVCGVMVDSPPLNSNALVEMYHSQAQWNNRCSPRVYSAFCELWKRDDLWVSLDRVGVKLPSVDKHP
jgi:hypothetical protein